MSIDTNTSKIHIFAAETTPFMTDGILNSFDQKGETNMQFVWWLTGVLATLAACKFVLRLFKRLTGKENIDRLISAAGDKIHEKADKIADRIQDRRAQKEIQKHIQQRTKDEENRPIVTIR